MPHEPLPEPESEQLAASAKEFQTGYERRVRVYYRLITSAPWPENIHAAIIAKAGRRKASNRKDSVDSDSTQ